MYDNWQKQKRVELSKIVGGDAKFLSFIVGYYIRSQPTQIDLSRIGQVNYQFERKDCEAALLRCEDSLIDGVFFSLFDQFPKANHSISILDTSNFPPIEANSSSEKDINDEVIDSCLINTMKGHKRFIFSGSDPEPSFLHQKLTNKRLHLNDEDPIKNILNFPGRMHIEMHVLNSISSFQPYLFLVLQFFFVGIWGFKPDLVSTSLDSELERMIKELDTFITRNPDFEDAHLWTDDFKDEMMDLVVNSIDSLPSLHKFFKIFVSIPIDQRKMSGLRRTYLNLPDFSKLRIYLRSLLEGWNELELDLRCHDSPLTDLFNELHFFMTPIKDAQTGTSSTFFSRFGSMIALFKISNRPKLVQVGQLMYDC